MWSSESTYLRKGEGATGNGGGKERSDGSSEPPEPKAIWQVPDDIGRRYASVSGDINPIHMHSLSAKLFGMPGAIAHGMWMKAHCLASLEHHLRGPHRAEVSFKTPLKIPGKAAFSGETEFALHNARNGKPHLTGKISPL